jgi:hypothetical protein
MGSGYRTRKIVLAASANANASSLDSKDIDVGCGLVAVFSIAALLAQFEEQRPDAESASHADGDCAPYCV